MKFSNGILALLPALQSAQAKVWLAGVNMAGFDFGCGNTLGNYSPSGVTPPLSSVNGINGIGQMQHFASSASNQLNVFRLPVCWQYLVNNQLGGSLDESKFAVYNQLVQGCLNTGAYCVVDLHNYARWGGQVVGQSGSGNGAPTNAHLASLWYQLAARYKSQSRIIFGIMNEPHDLNIQTWATTVQWSVDSIRNAGATSQMILLPGTTYTAVGSFVSSGSAAALGAVKNPNGSKTNLIFDVHQYLDADSSGTTAECMRNGVSELASLGSWLRSNGRQAFLTETGGGSTSSCYNYLCSQLDWMNYNSDVYIGWIGWGAGAFQTSYVLSNTPTYSNGMWTDTGIVKNCIAGKFK